MARPIPIHVNSPDPAWGHGLDPALAPSWLAVGDSHPPERWRVRDLVHRRFTECGAIAHDPADAQTEGRLPDSQRHRLAAALDARATLWIGTWDGNPTSLRGSDAPTYSAGNGIRCHLSATSRKDFVAGRHQNSSGMGGPLPLDPCFVPYQWWDETEGWLVITDMDCRFTLVAASSLDPVRTAFTGRWRNASMAESLGAIQSWSETL